MTPRTTAQHRLPCPSPSPGAHSNSCPSSRWRHPTISASVVPFSFCFQSFPASGSFQINRFFASGGQNVGVSASASVLPMNIQDWFPLGWTGWVSLQSKGLSRVFSNTTVQKHRFFSTQVQRRWLFRTFYLVQLFLIWSSFRWLITNQINHPQEHFLVYYVAAGSISETRTYLGLKQIYFTKVPDVQQDLNLFSKWLLF